MQECEVQWQKYRDLPLDLRWKNFVNISLCIGDDVRELEAPLQMVAYALICQHQEIEQELQNRIPMKCVFKHKDTTIHITKKEDWMNVSAILHCQSLYVYKQVLHCLQLEKTRDFFYFIS